MIVTTTFRLLHGEAADEANIAAKTTAQELYSKHGYQNALKEILQHMADAPSYGERMAWEQIAKELARISLMDDSEENAILGHTVIKGNG